MSGNWTLTPYVTSKVVGVEKVAEAHGILMFFGGVGLMLGPPVVGKMDRKSTLKDRTETPLGLVSGLILHQFQLY